LTSKCRFQEIQVEFSAKEQQKRWIQETCQSQQNKDSVPALVLMKRSAACAIFLLPFSRRRHFPFLVISREPETGKGKGKRGIATRKTTTGAREGAAWSADYGILLFSLWGLRPDPRHRPARVPNTSRPKTFGSLWNRERVSLSCRAPVWGAAACPSPRTPAMALLRSLRPSRIPSRHHLSTPDSFTSLPLLAAHLKNAVRRWGSRDGGGPPSSPSKKQTQQVPSPHCLYKIVCFSLLVYAAVAPEKKNCGLFVLCTAMLDSEGEQHVDRYYYTRTYTWDSWETLTNSCIDHLLMCTFSELNFSFQFCMHAEQIFIVTILFYWAAYSYYVRGWSLLSVLVLIYILQ
jgi:hypothetical protein